MVTSRGVLNEVLKKEGMLSLSVLHASVGQQSAWWQTAVKEGFCLSPKKKIEEKARNLVLRYARGKDDQGWKGYQQSLATLETELKKKRTEVRPGIRADLKEKLLAERKVSAGALQERVDYLLELEKAIKGTIEELRKQAQPTNVGHADIESFRLEIAN